MHFDAGALQGAELLTGPEAVKRFVELREMAWQAARIPDVAAGG